MHLYLKNKFLYFKDYKIKCSIGKMGLTKKKTEGDLKHQGVFLILNLSCIDLIESSNIQNKLKKLK